MRSIGRDGLFQTGVSETGRHDTGKNDITEDYCALTLCKTMPTVFRCIMHDVILFLQSLRSDVKDLRFLLEDATRSMKELQVQIELHAAPSTGSEQITQHFFFKV